MKCISRAKYFSIIGKGRHSDSPLVMYTKDSIDLEYKRIPGDWGNENCYRLSDIDKISWIETISRMDDLLDDIEQHYPEDTWLTLRIYDKNMKCIYEVSDSCENDYGEVRDIIVDFLKNGTFVWKQ